MRAYIIEIKAKILIVTVGYNQVMNSIIYKGLN
jgi:hypothetical protein